MRTVVQSITSGFGILMELSKIRISQLVAMSTVLGYVMATGELSWRVIFPTLGTFLLSCGSAALNQYQERRYDGQMKRTRHRPIPAGRITPAAGLFSALGMMTLGGIILYLGANPAAFWLGMFNIFWYNGVYTPLKRITPYAIFPGALIGAIPPAIGWVAGGGGLWEMPLLAISFFFFVWQVPHYWLLLSNLSEDYQRAGFPTLTSRYSRKKFAKITFSWILATSLTTMLIPLFGDPRSVVLIITLFLVAAWLLWNSRSLLSGIPTPESFRHTFKIINVFMLLVLIALMSARLLGLHQINLAL